MMHIFKRCLPILGVVWGLAVSAAMAAGEFVITYPEGWAAVERIVPHDASPMGYAVVAYKYKGGDPTNIYDRSLVIQAQQGGENVSTEFAGKVFYVKYSATGNHLLVQRVGALDLGGNEFGVHLLDSQGQVLWSKQDDRIFGFSTTGEVVYAWYEDEVNPDENGRAVEIFDLAGNSTRIVTFDSPVMGVVVIGSGQKVVMFTPGSIVCLKTQTPPTIAWRYDLPGDYPSIKDVYLLDSAHVVAKLERAASIVLSLDGVLQYTFDPQALADSDPLFDARRFAAYQMFDGPSPGTITLFDRTAGTRTLNIATGELTARKIDTSLPNADYKMGVELLRQNLFFFSEEDVHVRTLE